MRFRISGKATAVDILIYYLMAVLFVFFLISLDYGTGNPFVLITFFINGTVFLLNAFVTPKGVTLRRNIYIFSLIFFFFAPLQQYLKGTLLWSGNGMLLTYSDSDYLGANFLILISCLCTDLGYFLRKEKNSANAKPPESSQTHYRYETKENGMRNLALVTVVCTLAFETISGFLKGFTSSALLRQALNMIRFVPVSSLVISILCYRSGKLTKKWYMVLFAVCSVLVFAVFSGEIPRYLLLGSLMTVLSLLLKDYRYKSFYMTIYVFGFFFAFSQLRYVDLFHDDLLEFVDFCHADYDAYQMLMMTVRYVKEQGVSMGMNLISALLCIVPRSIFPWRLEATGTIVIGHFGSWFTNVSCPLVGEMYFAFGFLGVVVLSFLLGLLVRYLDSLEYSSDVFRQGFPMFISGLSIYILRGALLPAYSYSLGIILSFWALQKLSCVHFKLERT